MKDKELAAAAAKPRRLTPKWYADLLSTDERTFIRQQLESLERTPEMEVAIMRVMIRRVMERLGESDPARALPLVRQGVDAICRALRAERVLKGQASESLTSAFATALHEISEEIARDSG